MKHGAKFNERIWSAGRLLQAGGHAELYDDTAFQQEEEEEKAAHGVKLARLCR